MNEEGVGKAYPVLGQALMGAKVAFDLEELPTDRAHAVEFIVNATIEDARSASRGCSAAVFLEDMGALVLH